MLPGRLIFSIMSLNIKIKQPIPSLISMLTKALWLWFGFLFATHIETRMNNSSASLVLLPFLLDMGKCKSWVYTLGSWTNVFLWVCLWVMDLLWGVQKKSLLFCRMMIRCLNFWKIIIDCDNPSITVIKLPDTDVGISCETLF